MTHLNRGSFFNEFEEDRMTGMEMFDALGGIERNETVEDVIAGDFSFEDTIFDNIVPDWKNKTADLESRRNNSPEKEAVFFTVRSFRTLLQFLCIKFKNNIFLII